MLTKGDCHTSDFFSFLMNSKSCLLRCFSSYDLTVESNIICLTPFPIILQLNGPAISFA